MKVNAWLTQGLTEIRTSSHNSSTGMGSDGNVARAAGHVGQH